DSFGNGEVLTHFQDSLDQILSKVDRLVGPPSSSSGDVPSTPTVAHNGEVLSALEKLSEQQSHLAQRIVAKLANRIAEELDLLRFQQIMHETLTTELDRREAEAADKREAPPLDVSLPPDDSNDDVQMMELDLAEEPPPEAFSSNEDWSRAVWGDGLVDSNAFAPYLETLNRGLLNGDRGIGNLAGQLLIFRQAPPEAKPQLLKDIGEAYYRTQIDSDQPNRPFERALIEWLQTDCDNAGLPNTIEVVHIGERFDKSRHTSTTRGGVEVSEVFGWIVLTEGGRVYTRASVAAQ
ncbi:MAG: hypothetical protein KDA84_29365, partial [Planctomycetaceae bacterium]|nr:hypothetical protein [Planctomycetaceae bacterium]